MNSNSHTLQIIELIEMYMRSQNLALEDAMNKVAALFPKDHVDEAMTSIRTKAQRQQLLKVPAGVTKLDYARLLDDARGNQWYTGPNETDKHWPPLRASMVSSMGEEVAESVDVASSKIISLLSDPGVYGLSKRGLVLGYVQSGKTANYSAVCAKGADVGFRLFIVLSGIHNSLRSQTQVRLEKDLISHYRDPWVTLTNRDQDFGRVHEGAGLLSARELRNLVVIKKNASRLQRLVDWLESIHENVRRSCPAIVIDDEADQATPNSQAARNEISKINALTRKIFKLLPTATYIGYTATPFANVLIDPNDDDDLYPGDFIINLPRPNTYFGAEQLFGREQLNDLDKGGDIDGHDMIRLIRSEDIELLNRGTLNQPDSEGAKELPESLLDAIRWFVLTVAARWERGQRSHTSMLIHTSHRVIQHDDMYGLVKDCVNLISAGVGVEEDLKLLWHRESGLVAAAEFGRSNTTWEKLLPLLPEVFAAIKILIDNGTSNDRLNYDTDLPQTVIAVGGQTLSRGLTLEGLTVSYFLRTSKTYDTLLQMGRWFGYRIGYEELPRVWMSAEMRKNFRDLATIEQEIRNDIERYTDENITPMDMGLRIRQHPTMAITAGSKMHFAEEVNLSYAGSRKQIFRFDNNNSSLQKNNINVTQQLIKKIQQIGIGFSETTKKGKWVAKSVPAAHILSFLDKFSVAEEHIELQPELTVGYLKKRTDLAAQTWNVAVMGSSLKELKDHEGNRFETGVMDLALPAPVITVNRAPLNESVEGVSNIKALMSAPDRFIDLEIPREAVKSKNVEATRLKYSQGTGLLLIYPISGMSRPTVRVKAGGQATRKRFDNPVHMIGLGIVFPDFAPSDKKLGSSEHTYIGLPLSMMPPKVEASEDDELEIQMLSTDSEGTADFDGADKLSSI